jgi:hypothetical protein
MSITLALFFLVLTGVGAVSSFGVYPFVPKGQEAKRISVPQIGVHPRLFFSDADRDEIFNRTLNDPVSKSAYESLLPFIRKSILNSTSTFGPVYESLKRGEIHPGFNLTLPIVTTRSFVGFDSKYSRRGIGAFWNMTGEDRSIYSVMASYSFVLWLQQNDSLALYSHARAIATAAKYHRAIYPQILKDAKLSATPKYYDNEVRFELFR